MNIIKIKDILLTEGLSDEQLVIYNCEFRGRYVACPDWTHCCPLDWKTQNELIELSRSGSTVEVITDGYIVQESGDNVDYSDIHWILLNTLMELGVVDLAETERINSTAHLSEFNKYVPTDITTDDLKKFRTWLATTLLTFSIDDSKIRHMLNYYKEGMVDNTVRILNIFGKSDVDFISLTANTSCGCHQDNLDFDGMLSGICDTVAIYKRNIYNFMVEIFSDINFWLDFDPEFITMFKRYIDGIITADFDLTADNNFYDYFVECGCQINSRTLQDNAINILKSLSQALELIINGETVGKKNFISTALNKWAQSLYEVMEW